MPNLPIFYPHLLGNGTDLATENVLIELNQFFIPVTGDFFFQEQDYLFLWDQP